MREDLGFFEEATDKFDTLMDLEDGGDLKGGGEAFLRMFPKETSVLAFS